MKRLFILSLCFLLALTVVGCSREEKPDTNTNATMNLATFEAQVVEVYAESILVRPCEGSNELNSADSIHIPTKNFDVDLKSGDTIEITYDGMIAESYPAQIHNVFNIKVVETTEKEPLDWGITLSAKDISANGMTLIINQKDGKPLGELMMGCDYKLEKMVENEWQPIPEIIENAAWTAEAYMIKHGGVTEFEVNWNWLYGELAEGEYRIIKPIMDFKANGDNTIQDYTFEFKI